MEEKFALESNTKITIITAHKFIFLGMNHMNLSYLHHYYG